MHKLGVKRVYCYGVVQTAVCALLFGTLDFIEDKTLFLGLSYLLRILESVAEAASWSAVFAMLLHMFPDNVATMFAISETFFGIGMIVGPTVGGALYEAGGFTLPFAALGGVLVCAAVFCFFVLPNTSEDPRSNREKPSVLQALKVPPIVLAMYRLV